MAVITNLFNSPVVPSDVFGYEVNTDVGYGRETFNITITSGTVRVGTILVVDYAAGTATPLAAPANAAAVKALGDLAVWVGRDLTTNPATVQDFDRLTQTATGIGVAIVKGDGRGILKKGYLDVAGTQYYALPADVQAALDAKFTKENRFKMVEQQYTPA
ncbi:TPA: hypothetical protein NNW70_004161 [Salmonella enterica]|nr:hypothetical protein [Salmonella enterica]HCH9607871.1 hypothetical protein [Salmonella enterica]HDI5000165.1 hypothetical protein [Salmonella enterica]